MSVFVPNERFEIIIKYLDVKSKSGLTRCKVIDEAKKEDKAILDKHKDKVKELHTSWELANFKQMYETSKQCHKFDFDSGRKELDWLSYKAQIIETYMKGWDASDDSGKPVPCTKENIEKLDPDVANGLIDAFFNKTSITEEELGN